MNASENGHLFLNTSAHKGRKVVSLKRGLNCVATCCNGEPTYLITTRGSATTSQQRIPRSLRMIPYSFLRYLPPVSASTSALPILPLSGMIFVKVTADKYRRARAALLKLGLPETDTVLQLLRDDQLWMKNVNEPQKLGETALNDPWIWTVGRPKGLSKQQEAYWSEDSTYITSALGIPYFDTCPAQWITSNGFVSGQIEIATVKRWRLWRWISNVPSFCTPVWPRYGPKWPTAALKIPGARHMPGRR